MNVHLPARWEFGWVCMGHAPQVYADHGRKVVCCEPGLEAMYPGAAEYVHVERKADELKRSAPEHEFYMGLRETLAERFPRAVFVPPDKGAVREYFIPKPTVAQVEAGQIDVVVCPRRRAYGPDKNWPHWCELTDQLWDAGLTVFAGGAAATSFRVNAPSAWDYRRDLDATIEAMMAARLVIATDAGLAHLAVLCGRPLLMIAHANGITAPGVCSDGKPYIPIQMNRYQQENHTGSPITVVNYAWEEPRMVARRSMDMLA